MGSSSNNHPDYPDPSLLINVSNFVSIKLSASNYQLWKTQMRCFIDNVGLLGFIGGMAPSPPPLPPSSSSNGTTNDEYRRWRRLDQRVKGWILGSLSEEVLATVVGFDTASDVWTELQHSFDPYFQPLVQMKENSEHEAAEIAEEDIDLCQNLYRAAVTGDLLLVRLLLSIYPNASKATRIASGSQTALHVAVGAKKTNHFVEKFVESMITEELEKQTTEGNTALSVAAMVGNAEAAKILVAKHPSLLYTENCYHSLPMHMAAKYAHGNTLWYLLTATEDHLDTHPHNKPFEGQSGVRLLVDVIISGFIDIALYLVLRYPRLAILKTEKGDSPLTAIARKASAFRSGNHYHFWEKIIYFWYPRGPGQLSDNVGFFSRERSVSALRDQVNKGRGNKDSAGIMHIGRKKWLHFQALELVKCLCTRIRILTNRHSHRLHWEKPILLAASLGIHEVVEEIVHAFPNQVWSNNEDRNHMFLLALKYRCNKVFNLIYQIGHKYSFSVPTDTSRNNILHIAGKLAPSHKLKLVSGAALQMQSELQWFKEVQMFVNPACKEEENSSKETPEMVFTKEHSELVVEGERWMKDTANSCTIVAALIATVVFAAAITVPGGNNGNNGLPIFFERTAFRIFFYSEAISLFASVTSLLMFLSILTARYAEEDFLYALPNRLIIGLVTLFASITSMMIAFSSILYLVFGRSNAWILIPLILFACLPVSIFMFLQFPLLVDVIFSTYGRGIFRKQNDLSSIFTKQIVLSSIFGKQSDLSSMNLEPT